MTETSSSKTPMRRVFPYGWTVLLLLVAVVAVGIWQVTQMFAQARASAYVELADVAKLKTREIEGWLHEKETYLAVPPGGVLAATFRRWLDHGAPPDADRRLLVERLDLNQRRAGEYSGTWLFDTQGRMRLAGEHAAPDAEHVDMALFEEALREARPVLVDFHPAANGHGSRRLELEVITPLFMDLREPRRAVGFLVYRIDPNANLFPQVQAWPTASTTAEALLFRVEGNRVVRLTPRPGSNDAEAGQTRPLSDAASLIAAAARQGSGMVAGLDDHGGECFAVVERVGSRGWFVLSKIDRGEVYGKVQQSAVTVLIAGTLLIAALVFIGLLSLRHEQQLRQTMLLQAEVARSRSAKQLDHLVRHAHDIILLMDEQGNVLEANDAALRAYGREREELLGCNIRQLRHPSTYDRLAEQLNAARRDEGLTFESLHCRRDGTPFPVEVSSQTVEFEGRNYRQSIIRDISERKQQEQSLLDNLEGLRRLNRKLEDAQAQLLQAEKMASIGQLAAGVAHELNNPIGFVHSNLGTLQGYLNDIFSIIDAYEQTTHALSAADRAGVDALKRDKDLGYLRQDAFQLMEESRDGLARVRKIVQDLKDFSRVGDSDWRWADLHQGLDSTLNIVWNELKYKCEVHKHYGELPQVYCLPSQLNQVFMNILVNAGQAIEEKGEITIATGSEGDRVWVEIADTGKGIARENLTRIFEPFYTTKPVGKGTGLGLSLSYSIVKKHQGRIEVTSEVGKGSRFRVILPVQPQIESEPGVKASEVNA